VIGRFRDGRAAYGRMEHQTLSFTPVEHPDPRVLRLGFELGDPYLEQCWSAVLGPSSTLLLRRLPTMWIARVPAEVDAADLSQSLGLGASTTPNSRFGRTLQRLVDFGMARRSPDGDGLDVFGRVPPLNARQLSRVPEWTRTAHHRLLDVHLERFADPLGTSSRRPEVVEITARLDRLQSGGGSPGVGLDVAPKAVGR